MRAAIQNGELEQQRARQKKVWVEGGGGHGMYSFSMMGCVRVTIAAGALVFPTEVIRKASPTSAAFSICCIFFLRLYFRSHNTKNANKTNNANPPTTEPTIIQTFEVPPFSPPLGLGTTLGGGEGADLQMCKTLD
ncbi:unnamed protein product, partial [Vitis vinifera]